MSAQLPLIVEDFDAALTTCVQVLGGAKKVGVLLRPEYDNDPDKAARWLLACLNPGRDEKLTWAQTFHIMRAAKNAGCHVAMGYITQELGYLDPQPIEPEDEQAAIQRELVELLKRQETLVARAERVIGARR